MIPLIGHVNELTWIKERLEKTAQETMKAEGCGVDYKFGTMIEIARAALTADEIAELAQFFSFGTNDLTQTTFGISRDDAEKGFLLAYVDRKILPANPFQVIDRDEDGCGTRTGDAAWDEHRHLWRTWRRPIIGRVLPYDWPGLCVLLALPRAVGPAGGGSGSLGREEGTGQVA
jgi:phosphoenolpyruvate synthase/pyruvate phosphate dikinase